LKEQKYKESISNSLKLKYITTEKFFLTETGVMFTKDEVKGKSTSDIKAMYDNKILGQLYDYSYMKNNGFLRKSKHEEYIRSKILNKNNKDVFVQTNLSTIANKLKTIVSGFSAISVLRIALVVIGIVSVTMSADFTVDFLSVSNPLHRAVRLSWTMVIFAVLSLDLVVYFFNKGGFYYILTALFACLWIIVTGFSMFSTMEVQYRGYTALTESLEEDNSEINTARVRVSVLERRIDSLQREIESGNKAIDSFISRENYSVWWLTQLQEEQRDKVEKLDALLSEKEAIVSNNPDSVLKDTTRKLTFYDQVEIITGIKAGNVHFAVHILPAVFIDIIAPFSFAVATFMGGSNAGKKSKRVI